MSTMPKSTNPVDGGILERLFHLKEMNTNVRREILAGATTFVTMAYI